MATPRPPATASNDASLRLFITFSQRSISTVVNSVGGVRSSSAASSSATGGGTARSGTAGRSAAFSGSGATGRCTAFGGGGAARCSAAGFKGFCLGGCFCFLRAGAGRDGKTAGNRQHRRKFQRFHDIPFKPRFPGAGQSNIAARQHDATGKPRHGDGHRSVRKQQRSGTPSEETASLRPGHAAPTRAPVPYEGEVRSVLANGYRHVPAARIIFRRRLLG